MKNNKGSKAIIVCALMSLLGLSFTNVHNIENSLDAISNNPFYAETNDGNDADDSKYILSPITDTTLNSTFGSNYYILVSEVGQYIEGDNGGQIYTHASAFCVNSPERNTFAFNFDFVNEETKTIDIRDLGANAGGAIVAYVTESVEDYATGAGVKTYNSLVSMSNYSFINFTGATSGTGIGVGNIFEIEQSISFDVTKITDQGTVPSYTFYSSDYASYLYGNSGQFKFDGNTEPTSIQTDAGNMQIYANSSVYVYSVSKSLAEELCFAAAASKINDVQTSEYREIYQNLPFYDRVEFIEFCETPNRNISTLSQNSDSFHTFGQRVYDGAAAYWSEYQNVSAGYGADHYTYTIDYEHGYITGFSPFEIAVKVLCNDGEDIDNSIIYTSSVKGDDKPYLTRRYKNQKLYLINEDGMSYYGKTITLSIGDDSNYPNYCGVATKDIEIEDYDPYVGTDGLSVDVFLGFSGRTIECNFDGEIQFAELGQEGEYEYALFDYSLYENWGSYYQNVNLDVVRWQTSPIFTHYQSTSGLLSIDEETFFFGAFRRKGTQTTIPSPVLGIGEFAGANNDDGYIARMSVLNEKLYEQYVEENEEMYEALADNINFEDLSLGDLYYDASEEIESLESKDEAYGLQTPEGLEHAYEATVYIHTIIYNNLMDAYSPNQTTRSANIKQELCLQLRYYELDYTISLDDEIGMIDTVVSEYMTMISNGLSIDNLCKTFIDEFNTYLKNNPQKSADLRSLFSVYFYLIRDCETLTQAQNRYQEAKSAIEAAIEG